MVQEKIDSLSADFSVQSHFGKIWQRNILVNTRFLDGTFPDRINPEKTAAIVAAGPSLDRSIEKNSIGSPNLNFETYKYDMTIRIPQLHVYFKRYTDLNLRTLYLTDFGMPYFKLYDQGTGDVISSDKKVTMRECLEEIYQAEDLSELECIIEMPYRFHIFE